MPNAEPVAIGLREEEALNLLRRAAGARALSWSGDPREVRGVGGFTLEMTERPGPETVVWGTLGKDDGVLALFAGERLLATTDRSLGAIRRVQPVSLPELPHFALLVDDRVDNRLGAYHLVERRHLYVWDGHALREVIACTLLEEQYVHAQWENSHAPANWRLERVEGAMDLQGGNLRCQRREETLEAVGRPEAGIPPLTAFRPRAERKVQRNYHWDPRLRRFLPDEPQRVLVLR